MSAPLYAMPGQGYRYPFSDVNHARQPQQPFKQPSTGPYYADPVGRPLPVPQKASKVAAADPPLPRQNTKTAPPSPPKVIRDSNRGLDFVRVGLLGEGGFARVYEVKDARGNRTACKVVTNSSLKTKKAKTKLYAEIKIHRSLTHPNIVRFNDCFEDSENVYLALELCPNGSLMDLLRRRRRFTEPEARYYMVQLLGACHYMHSQQVIHRDLKLGNLFLDAHMNLKVGDFGLAALIESPGERKKTICGTPNYIAPEVLFDTANGHSFEVDTWSVGVILYTLVVGRPPFQTKEVKEIYQRIRKNEYAFPTDRVVSEEVQELVSEILTPDPQQRPALHAILDHEWFTEGAVPSSIPLTAHDAAPSFRHLTRGESRVNLIAIRRAALLEDDQQTQPAAPLKQSAAPTLAQQEKEFQHAVQPGSPIAALLRSARQPLVVAPPSAGVRESPLLRKLQAAARTQGSPLKNPLRGIGEEDEEVPAGRKERNYEEMRKKELESQKARIVAQMAPGRAPTPSDRDEENRPPIAPRAVSASSSTKGKERVASAHASVPASASASSPTVNGFDAALQTLTAAFDAKDAREVFYDPREEGGLPDLKVFIGSWVDYCNKYGMGYALTDGTVGVHFNDSTTIVLSADKLHFDYVSSRRNGTVYVRKNYTVDTYPEELKSKVYLLKHFERYIMDRLYGEYEYTFEDTGRTKGMDFVQKYLRMKHVIVFKMSHDSLQFNFYDHSKVILSSHGLAVTHIDKEYNLTRWTLREVMAAALSPPKDEKEAKFVQRLTDKLRYCKDVLHSIREASANTKGEVPAISPKTSKASLR